MGKLTHKNKFINGWFTKLCDGRLYAEVRVAYWWKEVTCAECLARKPKRAKEGK